MKFQVPSSLTSMSAGTVRLAGLLLALVVAVSPLAIGQSARLSNSLGVRETPRPVLDGSAKLVQHYDPSQMLRLVVGLVPPHMDQERQFLDELGTRGSAEFHHFLTAEEWSKRFDPSEQDEQAVVDWALSQGLTVTHRFPNRLLVDLEAPVSVIEKAFNVTINTYQLSSTSFFSIDRDPTIPSALTSVIQSVGGLNNFMQLRPANKNMTEPSFPVYAAGPASAKAGSGSHNGDHAKYEKALKASQKKAALKKNGVLPPITGGSYDPTDIYSSEAYNTNGLYQFGHCCNPLGNPGGTPPQTSIAIATAGAHLGSDISGFQAQYPYLAYHWFETYIDGTPACCDGEGTMDMEWSLAMANSFGSYADTASVIWYSGVNANFSTFNDIWNQMLSDGSARTMTTSWGCQEYYCYDASDMNTADSIFSSMVGQGWTLIAASGDQGATAGCGGSTLSDAIQFPSSDPNVVAAGGTNLSLSNGPFYNYEYGWTGGPYGCGSNDGGSTGGFSVWWGTPGYQTSLGFGSRGVPDIALNADWYNSPQNLYFQGSLSGNGGTSIVAPETAGFFANEESYLLYLSSVISGGLCNGHGCGPLGNGNWYLYYFGENPNYPSHYPFYDITVNCNNNDITAAYSLGYWCAGSGWDAVTGWGSFNMMQLGWAINTYEAGDFSAPVVSFSGPPTSTWFNSDQIVSWTVADTTCCSSLPPTGVSGFTQSWDANISDSNSLGTPGQGDGYYSGPQYANATSGCLDFTGSFCAGSVGQGWHYVYVRAYDNSGWNAEYVYGPIGYDTISPVTTDAVSGTFNGTVYTSPVTVKLAATDASPGSGVAATIYQVGVQAAKVYTAPFKISQPGLRTFYFHSYDNASNVEGWHTVQVHIESPTTTNISSSVDPSSYNQPITFTAQVLPQFGAVVPAGKVNFKNGGVVFGSGILNSSGVATFTTTTALTPGSHTITATYVGSTAHLPSTSAALTQTVNKANTKNALVSSLNPSTHGTAVTFTATVTGAFGGSPTGTVNFKDGSTTIGSGTVNSSTHKATFTTSTLTVGTHSIKAVYVGNVNYNTSTSNVVSQVVQ